MFTDEEVRVLLREAADTVDVHPQTQLMAEARRDRLRRRRLVVAGAAAAAVLVVAGAAVALDRPNASPPVAPEPTETAGPELVTLPDLVGSPQRNAVRDVRRLGLLADLRTTPRACVPGHQVVRTAPEAGATVAAGSSVTLVTAGDTRGTNICPGGNASAHAHDVAEQLLGFAGDPRGEVAPFAPAVRLGLGEELHLDVLGRDLADPQRWEICAAYAERSCPMSALDVLPRMGDVIVTATTDPEDACFAGDRPSAYADRQVIRIESMPGAFSSCLDYASVDVYVDGSGLIDAVVLRLGSP